MESITKTIISQKNIEKIITKAFKNSVSILNIAELIDGYFNSSYKITLNNNLKIVLKIAPKSNINVLTYEKNIMRNEVIVNSLLSKNNPFIPEILYYDNSLKLIECEYFIMNYIEGIPLNKLKKTLNSKNLKSIYSQLGHYTKKINSIENNFFGDISNKEKQYNNWFECFYSMINDLFSDANKIQLTLFISKYEALEKIIKYKNELKKVKKASLVHKDLWDGNIFINPNTFEIEGIIDTERALYADYLLEIACGHLDNNKEFLSSYLDKSNLSKSELKRINLYKFYLYLIMVIECPYRNYKTNDQYNWALQSLKAVYSIL